MRGKGSTIVTIAISLFLVLAVLSPVSHSASEGEETTPCGGSGPDYPPPATGNWVIDSDTSIWDEIIIVNGSIIVTDIGKLTLINCTLKINCASDGQYKIRVDASGELYIYESLVTPFNTAFKYRFEVYGKLWTNHSTIEYMWGDENGAPYTGGIQIYDAPSEVWLNHTNVWRSGANGIHAIGAVGVNITGCNITDNTRMEVYASNSQYINLTESNFTDYIDARIGHGIWIRHSKFFNISHSYIASHQGENLRLNNTTYSQVTFCDIGNGAGWDNVGSGIGLDYCDSTLRIAWNNISDNELGVGITYISKSSPIIENNIITNNAGGIGNWGEPKSWNSEFFIYNNTLIHNQNFGIHIQSSNATILNNTLIIDNIVMRYSSARIEDCYIQGGNSLFLTDSNPFIVNSTINCLNDYSFNIDDASHPFTLNCTVDLWNHMYVWDPLSNVTVQNYLHVQVIEEDGSTPVPNAWVNVTDNGVLAYSGLTDANGEVRWIPVTNRTYLQDYWNPFHPFENITYNETIVQVEKGDLVFIDNSRIVGMNSSHWEIFKLDPEFNISLSEGWNLISLPLVQSDESIDQVLSSIASQWDCIQTYDPLSPEPWKTNNTYRPNQLNDFNTLNHKQGFWINITEPDVNLTVRGNIPTSTTVPLYAGWNLVGYPTLNNSTTVANALWGTGADHVEVFDSAEPYRIREVGPSYVMKPGEGYWIHVPADTVWVVDW